MLSEIRYVIRSLLRRKGFASVTILTLALGIGSATAIYSVVDWVLFQQPTYSKDIHSISQKMKEGSSLPYSWDCQYQVYSGLTDTFSAIAAESYVSGNVVLGAKPVQQGCGAATQSLFTMFDAAPVLGRGFLPEEFKPGKDDVVIISYYFWKEKMGGGPDVLGRKIVFNQRVCTVVGVFKEGQKFPGFFNDSVVKPLIIKPNDENPWEDSLYTFVRLKPGVTESQANAAISAAKVEYAPMMADFAKRLSPVLAPTDDVRKYMQPEIYWMLLGAVGFLYAIACLNATNLILVHLLGKQRELSIRMALGGSRFGLIRLLTLESLTICLLGSLIGGLAANWLIPVFAAATHGGGNTLSWNLGSRTYWVLGIMTVVTGALIAIIPAFHILRSGIQAGLKTGGGSIGEGKGLSRLRSAFVVIQASFAVILLVGAGLMIQTFQHLQNVPLGFDPSHRTKVQVTYPAGFPTKPEEMLAQQKKIQRYLQDVPGVTGVAFGSDSLLAGYEGVTFDITLKDHATIKINGAYISDGFEDVGGLKLVAGTWLPPNAKSEVMINESLAKKVFGNGNAVGQYINPNWNAASSKPDAGWHVVGVLADVRENLREAPGPKVYMPVSKSPNAATCYFVSSLAEPTGEFISRLQQALYACDPRVVSWAASPMAEARISLIHNESMALSVLRILAAIAILLTLVGMFSLMAYTVDRRMSEFGVRMALGATPSHLLSLVMRRGVALTVIGIVLGIAGSLAMTRYIQSLLFETPAVDPAVIGSVSALLLISAIGACLLPATRASKPDLVKLLKSD